MNTQGKEGGGKRGGGEGNGKGKAESTRVSGQYSLTYVPTSHSVARGTQKKGLAHNYDAPYKTTI